MTSAAPTPGPRATGPVLALDGSSARPGVALLGPEGQDWGCWQQPEGERGTARLAPVAAELLGQRGLAVGDLLGVAVGMGPGSYTGLRATIALARGLAFPGGLPLAGVVSLAAAARGILRQEPAARRVLVLLDARRGELYRAEYARGPDPEGVLEVVPPGLVTTEEGESRAAGGEDGLLVLREPVPDPRNLAWLGRVRLLAGGDAPATIRPLYLKRSHAELALEERARRGSREGA